MLENPIFLIATATLAAGVPVGIWIYFIFSEKLKSKKTVVLVFLLGCLTAPALLGIQYLWDFFPQFNLQAFIENSISDQNKMFIASFILFGAMEEIIKMAVIVKVDKHTLLINTFNDAIRYSIASALGFSFIENIYYLYQFYQSIGTGELIGMYIFRSIFTTAAHMIFSGIFGYFYGASKFSIDLRKQQEISGKKNYIENIIAKLFNIPKSQAAQQKILLKGLFIAVGIHAIHNYLLQFNKTAPVMIFDVLGYLYLQYLLKRKAGHLILATDISEVKKTTLAKKDEEVVLELISMWFKEKKYVDVIHICERLLERDPDNKVVKLFKAQAIDKLDDKDVYKKIISSVIKTKEDVNEKDKNIMEKYIRENKTPPQEKNKKAEEEAEDAEKRKSKENEMNKYTQGDSFRI
ncbi:PrsW family intramembrane metalloprotease [Candidatus Peregrinibacteria bacterium]|nr:PrsW family intramembrane metalloprotease [Candidatus Peregrinibacteria bacterium]